MTMTASRQKSGRWWMAAAAGLLLAACAQPSEPDGANGAAADDPPLGVVTAEAVIRPLGVQIEAVGTARANESVEVTSKTANTVVAIRFEEGELVRRGQVLVQLDDAEARASLAEAQAALADSESQFRRSRDLFTRQALSQSQLEQIEATLKGDRARLAAAQARLSDTVIRAGFSGRTGLRRVSVGGLVTPGAVITTLDDTSVIKLDFTVPETYMYVLQQGLPVTARTAGLPGREFKGEVTHLDSRVDPITRSITVRAQIANDDGLLRPGMFMTVSLQGAPSPALLVPEEAIVPEQGSTFVFVVNDAVVERREVRLGKRRPGEVEIVEGLREHERVIVEGTQHARDGIRVVEHPQDSPVRAGT